MAQVYLTEKAIGDIDECRRWWAQNRSTEQAERWHRCCEQAIESLADRADRCPIARESGKASIELRQLAFGLARRPSHRAVFTIRPERVVIYRVRHRAQKDLSSDEL